MRVVIPGQNIVPNTGEKILFLAGCTPRDNRQSWRAEALKHLSDANFQGIVCVPEPFCNDYVTQVEWEDEWLQKADTILFWIPRNMSAIMYGLTSNVEWGRFLYQEQKIVTYGRPDEAEHCRYLDYHFIKYRHEKPLNNLKELIDHTLERIK